MNLKNFTCILLGVVVSSRCKTIPILEQDSTRDGATSSNNFAATIRKPLPSPLAGLVS